MVDYNAIPKPETIQKTVAAIKERGIDVVLTENKEETLEMVKSLIPAGKTVMEGSSTTLKQIGFVDYLKSGDHPWQALHGPILKEEDQQKRAEMMRRSLLADYFLGSVNAIAQTGELVAADASGSRVGAYPYAAAKVIIVSGVNKIVPTLEDAIRRVREYVYPLENERAQKAYGMGSFIGKLLIIEREMTSGRIKLVLVKEKLGF